MKIKKTTTTILFAIVTLAYTFAQDTMYVMQKEGEVLKIATSNIDSVIFYAPPTSSNTGTITDIDNNTYKTVKIGNQWWMAENLKTTKYADGTAIPLVTDSTAWRNLGNNDTDKAYCFHNNDKSLGYGALYTYAAATNGDNSGNNVQGVCPTGWHLPSDTEWTELENYLADNGYNYDGTTGGGGDKIAKAMASQTGWNRTSNVGAVGNNPESNNKSGFSALPGGYRLYDDGSFYGAGTYGSWWSSTQSSSSSAYSRSLHYTLSYVYRYSRYKSSGRSVRCLRD